MADAMKMEFRTIEGVQVRCAESTGPSTPSIVLTSPWPESLYAFAPAWPSLANVAHLVAVDLPGFGRSERRDDLLSPRAMSEFLVRFVAEWELDKPHLVAPDIGTSAALFAAAARPDLLSSVVVGSGGAAVPIQLSGPLAEWVLAPDLEGFRGMDPRTVVGAALETIEGYRPPPDVLEDYLESYQGDRFVESMRYTRAYPNELPQLAERQFLDERLPNAKLVVVEAGHFVWEERADEYAALIAGWVTDGYRAAARGP
jgi:pimeloyl-ACP methyl ester carboxylesterase